MTPRMIATIRGTGKREAFKAAIGTDELQILSPVAERMYRIDPELFSPEQVSWIVARYGIAIPVDECTISTREGRAGFELTEEA